MVITWIMINFILAIAVGYVCGDTTQILSGRRMDSNAFIRSEKIYKKFQTPTSFLINGASNVYAKVTGFTTAFHHTVPLLYKITFDAICTNSNGAIWVFPRIMVNNQLFYNDRFIPNTEDRYKLIPGYTEVHTFDHIGAGQYAFFSAIATTIRKSELIYLQPGLHVVDVAARAIGNMPVRIYFGVLTIELVEFNDAASIGGMVPMNVTSIN
ncbi:unnamed protein product [Rotaria magnacalcarata]|uniref:Uncharacterized protein n=1 Tax=Rotaria magnacalcarata TaxID=392030 RepID=A0A816TW24_9BILA|nr:unnamed protein product [Rotaria magnacalcarata]